MRGLVVVVCVVAAARTAAADDAIAKAQTAVDDSDFDTAKTVIADALASGQYGPEELADLYRLSGIVDASFGDAKAATEAFEHLLALSPKAALPPGTSPKIAKPFKAAQDFFKKREPIHAKAETTEHPATVALVIASDPLHMIAKARATFRGSGKAEQTLEATGTDRIAIELPRARRLDIRLAALDEHGNRVVELGSADVPIVIVDDTAPVEAEPVKPPPKVETRVVPAARRPVVLRWQAWGAATVVFVGAATAFGIATKSDLDTLNHLNAQSVDHQFPEAQAAESRARRDLIATQVFAIGAGALAVGTIILKLTTPHARTERVPSVTAVPLPRGGALAIGGRF